MHSESLIHNENYFFLLDGTLSPWLDYRGAVVSFETHPCDQLAIVNWMDKVESPLLSIDTCSFFFSQEVVVGLSSTLHTLFIDNTKACACHLTVT